MARICTKCKSEIPDNEQLDAVGGLREPASRARPHPARGDL